MHIPCNVMFILAHLILLVRVSKLTITCPLLSRSLKVTCKQTGRRNDVMLYKYKPPSYTSPEKRYSYDVNIQGI